MTPSGSPDFFVLGSPSLFVLGSRIAPLLVLGSRIAPLFVLGSRIALLARLVRRHSQRKSASARSSSPRRRAIADTRRAGGFGSASLQGRLKPA
jgi:hypothetical protein